MPYNVQCKKCANLQSDWCKLVTDSPDPDMVRDCRHYRTLRNSDRIRAMSDEELAIFIESAICPTPYNGSWCRRDSKRWNCKDCWLDWLKEEAEE